MGMVRISLYDFDPKSQEPKPPINIEMEYDDDMSLEEQGYQKVAITAGNDVGCGTVMLPLGMLSQLVAMAMAENMKRNTPSIIMPDNKIIRPN